MEVLEILKLARNRGFGDPQTQSTKNKFWEILKLNNSRDEVLRDPQTEYSVENETLKDLVE